MKVRGSGVTGQSFTSRSSAFHAGRPPSSTITLLAPMILKVHQTRGEE